MYVKHLHILDFRTNKAGKKRIEMHATIDSESRFQNDHYAIYKIKCFLPVIQSFEKIVNSSFKKRENSHHHQHGGKNFLYIILPDWVNLSESFGVFAVENNSHMAETDEYRTGKTQLMDFFFGKKRAMSR